MYNTLSFALPSLVGYRNEIITKKKTVLPLRYIGTEQLRISVNNSKTINTGIVIKEEIRVHRLFLETKSLAWLEGVFFEVVDFTPGSPVQLRVHNQTQQEITLFPMNFLTFLDVRPIA